MFFLETGLAVWVVFFGLCIVAWVIMRVLTASPDFIVLTGTVVFLAVLYVAAAGMGVR